MYGVSNNLLLIMVWDVVNNSDWGVNFCCSKKIVMWYGYRQQWLHITLYSTPWNYKCMSILFALLHIVKQFCTNNVYILDLLCVPAIFAEYTKP